MSLVLLLLGFKVIQVIAVTWLSKEGLVFVLLGESFILLFFQGSLGALLELIHQWHGKVLLPELELSLKLVV